MSGKKLLMRDPGFTEFWRVIYCKSILGQIFCYIVTQKRLSIGWDDGTILGVQ